MSTAKTNALLYMHAGAGNHGCEAIVRSVCKILENESVVDNNLSPSVLTYRKEEDDRYGLDSICKLYQVEEPVKNILSKAYYYILKKIIKRPDLQMKKAYARINPINKYHIAISIGGDNYCYDNMLFQLSASNRLLSHEGVPSALIGCSIEPEVLSKPDIVQDMKMYKLIVARETRTYDALISALQCNKDGICQESGTKVCLAPDPAFILDSKPCKLPENFLPEKTIGINVSPMILEYENNDNPGITLRNYRNLIQNILDTTNYNIALIPHVVTTASDDRIPLKRLYELFVSNECAKEDNEGRIILVEDRPAEELKYIISQCKMLITARTHASIAAYSTYVPTLVVGYSIKAMGIAKDLFGATEGYVCPVQELASDSDLVDAYNQLALAADTQRDMLKQRIPKMKEEVFRIKDLLNEV